MILVAQVFSAIQLVYEEKLIRKHFLHPLKMCGLEGLWGILLSIIVLPILQHISCNSSPDKSFCPTGKLEDSILAFRELYNNTTLKIYIFIFVFAIACAITFGIAVTKHGSALQRMTSIQLKPLLLWTFFLFYSGEGQETFSWFQLIGFVIIVVGSFMYNEIFVVMQLGYEKETGKLNFSMSQTKKEDIGLFGDDTKDEESKEIQEEEEEKGLLIKEEKREKRSTDNKGINMNYGSIN